MCDTFAIGPGLTRVGVSIFGKNSDREPDEAQTVLSIPRRQYGDGESLGCTYITIPQARTTHAAVLCKPFWIWGAEMGVNEKGVVIGNEALFTRTRPEKDPGLIGMDLLRLALERTDSARAACDLIIGLLKRYGQAGVCGYRDRTFTYMNSFLVMDRTEILVLETVGRDYALRRHQGHVAISNAFSLKDDWDESSFPAGTDVSSLADGITTYFAGSASRSGRLREIMGSSQTPLGIRDAFNMLRSHLGQTPFRGFNRDVCMHACDPLIRRSQTTGSMVVELDQGDRFRIFVTAGAAPCVTPFKPFLPACPDESAGRGGGRYSEDSCWWRHHRFYLNALLRYGRVQDAIADRVADLEERFCLSLPGYSWDSTDETPAGASREMFLRSQELDAEWLGKMSEIDSDMGLLRRFYLKRVARQNGISLL